MGSLAVAPFLPSKLRPSIFDQNSSLFPSKKKLKRKNQSISPVSLASLGFFSFFFSWILFVVILLIVCFVLFWSYQVARLFGPSIFEASKLKVLFLGVDEKKHPGNLPRTYTLTHSDITAKLTLAISQTINNSQVILFYYTKNLSGIKRSSNLFNLLIKLYFPFKLES